MNMGIPEWLGFCWACRGFAVFRRRRNLRAWKALHNHPSKVRLYKITTGAAK